MLVHGVLCTQSRPFILLDLLVLQASVHWRQQSRLSEEILCLLFDILQNFDEVHVAVVLVSQGFVLHDCDLPVNRDYLTTSNRSPKVILEDLRE